MQMLSGINMKTIICKTIIRLSFRGWTNVRNLIRYQRRSPVNFLPLDICIPEPVQRNSHSDHRSKFSSTRALMPFLTLYKNLRQKKICTMHLVSHYVVMFFWSAVCVRPQDPTNAASPPCKFIQPRDVPYTKCVMDVYYGSKDTISMPSIAVTDPVPTTVFTTVNNPTSTTMESSTTAPKPATITPTVHPSPNSKEETKFTTKTPTQSPMIVGETVLKNHSDRQNTTESTTCASVRMCVNTELYLHGLLVVCGVLMAIMATLSFCLYKQCKKQPVENPNLTRLISIPNPAFSNP
ncbi:uncharacterized protein LOC125268244 [Megalobrama amblycephala]|uniref:uncharacterized protein LOC125268244 n=1 Tax=Megalobrama amblycephala TaxID=75352 RepID=UPI0020147AC7|nr:uncharacterized protein LOC125268244 [Megalobrama amblycephala]